MFRNRPVSLALVGLFLWATACTSYRQIDLGDVPNHDRVRVTTPDGSWYMLDAPGIVSDTIKGHGAYPWTIPVEQVARVEARVPDHYDRAPAGSFG